MKDDESECGKRARHVVVGRERVAPQVKVAMNVEVIEVASSFKYFGSCFSGYGRPHGDVKIRVGEKLRAFSAMKMIFKVRSLSLGIKEVVVPTVTYGPETWCIRMEERRKLVVVERCVSGICAE